MRESDQFTNVCLQLEVRRHQVVVLKAYLEENDVTVPVEVNELLEGLGSVDGMITEGADQNIAEESSDDSVDNYSD